MSTYNTILDDAAREFYTPTIENMFRLSPEMMAKKFPRANVQQAFGLDVVEHCLAEMKLGQADAKMLCIGSHEDTCCDCLIRKGYSVTEIEPLKNYDLNTFYNLPDTQKGSFDVVFSISVIEHVENDVEFMRQAVDLLKPGGYGVFTMDYVTDKSQNPFPGNFSLYTEDDIRKRILPVLDGCDLLDEPDWKCENPDFHLQIGPTLYKYTFATLVFKKKA